MSDDAQKTIHGVLDKHMPTWKSRNHPTRRGIVVNLLACTGCEWIGDGETHNAHLAAEINKALGGLTRETRTNAMSSSGMTTNYNTGEIVSYSDIRRDARWASGWKEASQ
ncbi:hypothetical protein ABVN64_30240 [Mycolicibacterium conceptionense]|uniref:hypothetical protein n=1 Tax=Mycolicibacterium conceptionense TaxID=451644 RepID=UPI00336B3590